MKYLSSVIYLFIILLILSGCKEDTPVTNNEDPNVQNPQSPVLLTPGNGSTVSTTTPMLDWENYENASGYRVMASLDANINGTIILDTMVSGSSLTIPSGKVRAAIYIYWRVRANLQGGGNSNWSAIWKFRAVFPPPQPPVLVYPPNNSSNIPFLPLFDWNASAGAEIYRLQVSKNITFSQIVLDQGMIDSTNFQCPPWHLITGTQYFWRVNASNSGGLSTSDWSAVFNFNTIAGPLPGSISGRVTFADTNFLLPPSFYIVGAYSSWPPSGGDPDASDSLFIQQQGNVFYADYTILNVLNDNYVITLNGLSPQFSDQIILGIYGCDTARIQFSGCPLNPTQVPIINYNGVENINFLGWADTSKRVY